MGIIDSIVHIGVRKFLSFYCKYSTRTGVLFCKPRLPCLRCTTVFVYHTDSVVQNKKSQQYIFKTELNQNQVLTECPHMRTFFVLI